MLQQALNRHSQVVIPAETKYFSLFLGHCRRGQSHHLKRLNRDLGIDLPPPPKAVRGVDEAREFYARIAAAYLTRVGKPGATFFGEKTPVHAGYLPRIRRVFPESKIVWVYRDGRDVALSMRKVPWMSPNLAVNFLVWLFYYHKQVRAAKYYPNHTLFVRYEDLVVQPEKVLGRVADFLGLSYESAVASGHGNREGVLPWEYPWKEMAFEPITPSRVEAWRTELTLRESELLQWLGGRALSDLGYEVTPTAPRWANLADCPRILLDLMRYSSRLSPGEVVNQLAGRL